MKSDNLCILFLTIVMVAFSILFVSTVVLAQSEASYLYRLNDFNGPVSSMWARIDVDPVESEVFTLNPAKSVIRIYNASAMQVYDCGEGLGLASAVDIASTPEGDFYVLYRSPAATVRHLDFRGEVVQEFTVRSSSAQEYFRPEYLDYFDGKLFLADSGSKQVIVTSGKGELLEQIDFQSQLVSQYAERAKDDAMNPAQKIQALKELESVKTANFGGFSVDSQGNLYFTLSSLFVAYRYTPSGDLNSFGIPGSSPGKFGVVSSIAADGDGNIFISDRLRSVVLMFDSEFNFLNEFGYRGGAAHNLIAPNDIAVDEQKHRLYVAQAANLGVSVFNIQYD